MSIITQEEKEYTERLKRFVLDINKIIQEFERRNNKILKKQPTLTKGLNAAKRLHKRLSDILNSISFV